MDLFFSQKFHPENLLLFYAFHQQNVPRVCLEIPAECPVTKMCAILCDKFNITDYNINGIALQQFPGFCYTGCRKNLLNSQSLSVYNTADHTNFYQIIIYNKYIHFPFTPSFLRYCISCQKHSSDILQIYFSEFLLTIFHVPCSSISVTAPPLFSSLKNRSSKFSPYKIFRRFLTFVTPICFLPSHSSSPLLRYSSSSSLKPFPVSEMRIFTRFSSVSVTSIRI